MDDFCPINPRGLQRQVQRLCDVSDLHRRTELPGDNVAREVVQYRAEVKPAPTADGGGSYGAGNRIPATPPSMPRADAASRRRGLIGSGSNLRQMGYWARWSA